jgi:primosomal protein N'
MTDLIQTREDARRAWQDFEYGEYRPRFYKEKKGRKMEVVNPFESTADLLASQERLQALSAEYYEANKACFEAGLPEIDIRVVWSWKQVESPEGIRWVRTTEKEREDISLRWSSEATGATETPETSRPSLLTLGV